MKRKNILLLCGVLVFAFLLINNCANYSSPTTPDSISWTVKITTTASGGTTYPTPSFTVIWTAPAGLGSEYDMKSIYITIKKKNGEINTIKAREVLKGNFSEKDVADKIKEKDYQTVTVLVTNGKRTIITREESIK